MSQLISSSFNNTTHGFDNPLVKAVADNLGPFEIKPLNDGHRVQTKDCIELEGGNLYEGEWSLATGKQHGRGCLTLIDGSRYEGTWSQGNLNG